MQVTTLAMAGVTALGLTGLIQVADNAVPKAISVESLEYHDGYVRQTRTVRSSTPLFYAFWAAAIIDADTGKAAQGCEGGGSWPYEAGEKTVDIPLEVWVGSETCTPESLPPGDYFPRAVWSWGTDQTGHDGEIFTIGGDS